MRQLRKKLLFSAGLSVFIGALVIGCTDFSHPPDALGRLTILVVDSATNAGVGTLTAQLQLEDHTPWREVITSADGTGEFGTKDGGVIPGRFLVFLNLTGKNYQLAAGEQNYKPVTVVLSQTATVTFKLHKGIVSGPPGS